MGLICKGSSVCERTGLKHLRWRLTVSGGKVVQFTTGDEREYPVGFCESYAACLAKELKAGERLTEVFSGPNAPLSKAICDWYGLDLPGHRVDTQKGITRELQHLSQIVGEAPQLPPSESCGRNPWRHPESSQGRVQSLESMKQPSYQKKLS